MSKKKGAPSTPEHQNVVQAAVIPEAEQNTTPEVKQAVSRKEATKAQVPDFLTPYVKAYPTNKTFYVTSDRMVFLAVDRGLAALHQGTLKDGSLETYNI